MKSKKNDRDASFERFLTLLGEPVAPEEQIEESAERLLKVLEVECAAPFPVQQQSVPEQRTRLRKWWTVAAVAAAVLILGVSLHRMTPRVDHRVDHPVPVGSIVQTVDGAVMHAGDLIEPGQTIRTAGSNGAVLALSDGSHLELGAEVDLSIDRTNDGLQVNLANGSIIVSAAKQQGGHLFVKTRDCLVSVVGTVFSVNTKPSGSRVSVLEGEVHVQYGARSDVVHPGQQVRTNPEMLEVPLAKEIEWSRDAAAFIAMLSQLQLVTPSIVSDSKPTRGSISGMVVEVGTNDPIVNVTVEWSASPCDNFSVMAKTKGASTGRDGRFQFQNLDFGTYCLIPVHPTGAYVPLHYLQRGWSGRGVTVTLTDSDSKQTLRFEMEPTGTISGHVIDDAGEPAAYARVRAFEPNYRNGERQLIMLDSVYTDDRGEYRLPWLPSGKYFVSALPGDPRAASVLVSHGLPGRTEGFEVVSSPIIYRRNLEDGPPLEETSIPVWYGGTVDRNHALSVAVAPGKTTNAVNIALGSGRTRAFHVRGTVINGETGLPLSGAQIRIMPSEWVADPIVPTAISNSNGVFDVSGVSTGSRLMYALGAVPQGKSLLSGFADLNVDGDINGFVIKAIPPFDIEGRVIVEGAPGAVLSYPFANGPRGYFGRDINFHVHRDPDQVGAPTALIGANSASGFEGAFVSSSPTTSVGGDGKFTIRNIGPGNYHVYMVPTNTSSQDYTAYSFVPTLPNAYVKSFRIGTRDLLSSSLAVREKPGDTMELVLGTDVGEIEGRVLNDNLAAERNATVVLVPNMDRQRIDRYKVARTDTAGRFRLQGIAPGDYKLFAWSDVELGAWLDAEFLAGNERNSRAKAVRIDGGTHMSIDLTVIQGK